MTARSPGGSPWRGRSPDLSPESTTASRLRTRERTGVRDPGAWPQLERYVKDVVARSAEGERVLMWDLYSEPGYWGIGDESLPLVEDVSGWAREAGATPSLAVGVWSDLGRLGELQLGLSGVLTFHSYSDVEGQTPGDLPPTRPWPADRLYRVDGADAGGLVRSPVARVQTRVCGVLLLGPGSGQDAGVLPVRTRPSAPRGRCCGSTTSLTRTGRRGILVRCAPLPV
jgi:hypothetical protein